MNNYIIDFFFCMQEKDPKKPRIDEEEVFPTVGEHVENVNYINANDLRRTGAEDAQGRPVREIESLCMNCHQQGITRILFTSIPRFREVVVMSFQCPHCGFRSAEVQNAHEIQEKGVEYKLNIDNPSDFARQLVKSEYCRVIFPELDIEVPAGNGRITTLEGVISGMREDLARDQPVRKHMDSGLYEQIEEVCKKLQGALDGKVKPLTARVDDASGNSFLDYIPEEQASGKWTKREYERTPTQARQIGLPVPRDQDRRNASMAAELQHETQEIDEDVPSDMREEVHTIEGACPSCNEMCATHMKMVNIPHFKDVIIMSTVCFKCGYKSNEVKTGGAIPAHGRRAKLNLVEPEDLSRDILKSETCVLRFPELQLDLTAGTLGGKFTTIEGLLRQVYQELEEKVVNTESSNWDDDTRTRWLAFLARLQTAIDGQLFPFTLELEDPLAASYVQNVYAPDPDPEMTVEDYERTNEENEELGLNDMRV